VSKDNRIAPLLQIENLFNDVRGDSCHGAISQIN
jgi:hypothetical protein